MLDELLLLSGNDIPFYQAQIVIHVPSLKEIGMIGEQSFFAGCEMLTFSKDILSEEDRKSLENQNDFDILMSILIGNGNNPMVQQHKVNMLMVLSLLFPEYRIDLRQEGIVLLKEDETHSINNENFESFKEIINDIFCLKGSSEDNPEYNPKGDLASKIAEKFKERQRKLAEQKGTGGKINVLSRQASILAVGQQKDLNNIMEYTVYQLFDEIKRAGLKEEYDFFIKAKLAGARDLKEVEHWKKDIH